MASYTGTAATGLGSIGALVGLALVLANSPLMSYHPDLQEAFVGVFLFTVGILMALGGVGRG